MIKLNLKSKGLGALISTMLVVLFRFSGISEAKVKKRGAQLLIQNLKGGTMHLKRFVLLSVLVIFALTQLTGCSIVGVTIGAIADGKAKEKLLPEDATILTIKPGPKLEIGLENNKEIKGKLNAVTPLPESRYADVLKQFSLTQPRPFDLPNLNAPIKVTTSEMDNSNCSFLGFEGKNWIFKEVETEEIAKIHASSITAITDKEGNPLPVEMVKRLADMGQLPDRQSLILMARSGSLSIPLDDIAFIKRKKKSKKALIFGLIGLAVDVAFIVVSIRSWRFGFGGWDVGYAITR